MTARGEMPSTVSGATSVVDPATLRAYRESRYRVRAEPPLTLRVDVPSAGLQALHAARGVSCSVFVTAWNPLGRLLDASANVRRHAALVAGLTRAGTPFVPGIGEHPSGDWPGEESVLAFGLDLEAACALGRRHGQNAVLACGSDATPRLVLLR